MQWTIREFDVTRDADALSRIDTSYTSDRVYDVRLESDVIALEPRGLETSLRKRFPIDLTTDAWSHARVALLDDDLRGFIAWDLEAWNRRMRIWHFYVDLPYRRHGAGRMLIDAALAWARDASALTAWVETSHLNHPGIDAYRRLGFDICGFDTTLYRGTSAEGETAVYMARLVGAE